MKKNNTGSYYGLNKESYDNDVNEINKLISMLQDEINRETKKRDPEKDKDDEAFLQGLLTDEKKAMENNLKNKKIMEIILGHR